MKNDVDYMTLGDHSRMNRFIVRVAVIAGASSAGECRGSMAFKALVRAV